MPATIAFAKCTPHSVETLMVGFLGSIIKLNTEIIARLLSLAFVVNYDITIHDYSGLYKGIAESTGYSLLGLVMLRYVFGRFEFVDLQKVLQNLP